MLRSTIGQGTLNCQSNKIKTKPVAGSNGLTTSGDATNSSEGWVVDQSKAKRKDRRSPKNKWRRKKTKFST